MLIKIKQSQLLLLLLGCAAIAPPPGGPKDTISPYLLNNFPQTNFNINNKQKIIFEFNELIDPKSVPYSVHIEPQIKYKVKVRGQKIIIEP